MAGATYGLFAGAIALGFVHGVEPGHGWPVAASYALDQPHKWLYGFAASLILGVGHLVSSIAVVGVFFLAKSYFDLTRVNDPVAVAGFELGGPVSVVAGVLLVALGVREYVSGGHSHDHGNEHPHDPGEHSHAGHAHDDHDHGDARPTSGTHDDGHADGHCHAEHDSNGGLGSRLKGALPFVGGHSHAHPSAEDASERGLWGIAAFAFLLGFAHEEEFEIIALCTGSDYCLELMLVYAATVVVGIVGLTLLLIAGYSVAEERVERYTPYLPIFSAVVLVVMGVGFVLGLF